MADIVRNPPDVQLILDAMQAARTHASAAGTVAGYAAWKDVLQSNLATLIQITRGTASEPIWLPWQNSASQAFTDILIRLDHVHDVDDHCIKYRFGSRCALAPFVPDLTDRPAVDEWLRS